MPFQITGFRTGRIVGQPLDATFTSQWYNQGQDSKLSVHIHIENVDAVGTIAIEATNDTSPTTNLVPVAVPFDDGTGATVTSFTVSSGVDVDKIFRIVDALEGHYRLLYTRTSGGATNLLYAVALHKRA